LKPLSSLTASQACALRGVLFDLDDTLLDGGLLTEAAFSSLWRLSAAGLRLVVVTGRPAGWGEVIARQWPVDAVLTENGAVALHREGCALRQWQDADLPTRRYRRARIDGAFETLSQRFAPLRRSDDCWTRISDLTIDIGEAFEVPSETVEQILREAHAMGLRTFLSTVHLHLTLDRFDKASGVLALLGRMFGEDPTIARFSYAFIGDSANDDACFGAFKTSFGVANVKTSVGQLSVPPRFVASKERGSGFAEIADCLLELRTGATVVDRHP
jgi:HAD superfamily hydrolase (TIGR01484 family)